jgi:Xaa-Pro dipeptidase
MKVAPLDRVREWMDGQKAVASFITDPVSIGYLTGFRTNPHERLMGLVVRPEAAILVVPGLEASAAAEAAPRVEVRSWLDGEDPWAVVGGALGSPDGGRVGVEKGHLSLAAWERLSALVPAVEPVDAGTLVRQLRARKSPDEIQLLKQAAAITDQVTEEAMQEMRPGVTELAVATSIDLLIARSGAGCSFETIVQSGPNSALPHARPSQRRLGPGDLVLLDFGAAVSGYRADTTRMAVVGEPSRRQLEVHSVVVAARDAAVAAVRAGATAGDVDRAARATIGDAGLGESFIHRVGHGLGLEAHEDPSLDPDSLLELEAGMVVTIEPGVYLPGWGGVRVEDDVVVTASGCNVLTRADRQIRVVG